MRKFDPFAIRPAKPEDADDLSTIENQIFSGVTSPALIAARAIGARTTAYVCERHVCELPTSDPARFAAQIAKVDPL